MVLQLIDGSTVQGVLHTFTPFDHPSLPLEHRNRYVIKAARVSKGKGDEEKEIDTDGSNSGSGKTIIVEAEKVSQLIVKSIRLEQNSNPQAQPNGSGTTNGHANAGDPFRTDTDISSGVSNQNDDLVEAGNAWTAVEGPGAGASGGGGGLEQSSRGGMFGSKKQPQQPAAEALNGRIGEWDQFQANEQQFGVKASFDENLYTTYILG